MNTNLVQLKGNSEKTAKNINKKTWQLGSTLVPMEVDDWNYKSVYINFFFFNLKLLFTYPGWKE